MSMHIRSQFTLWYALFVLMAFFLVICLFETGYDYVDEANYKETLQGEKL